MNFFARLFGKCSSTTDAYIASEREQFTVREDTLIFPVLKNGEWQDLNQGAFCQLVIGPIEAPKLVVGFGYDSPNNFRFLLESDITEGDEAQITQQAYTVLEAIKSPFEIPDEFDGKVLIASGNPFASEKILCPNFMQTAHDLLNSEKLLVSIPRKRFLKIIAQDADEQTLLRFMEMHQDLWENDEIGAERIIHELILVERRQIVGCVTASELRRV